MQHISRYGPKHSKFQKSGDTSGIQNTLCITLSWGFYVPLRHKIGRSFRSCSSQPISWLVLQKLDLTQWRQTIIWNTKIQHKINKKITKARFGCLLWPPAWKRSRPILQLPGPQAAEHIMLTHCNDHGQLSWQLADRTLYNAFSCICINKYDWRRAVRQWQTSSCAARHKHCTLFIRHHKSRFV